MLLKHHCLDSRYLVTYFLSPTDRYDLNKRIDFKTSDILAPINRGHSSVKIGPINVKIGYQVHTIFCGSWVYQQQFFLISTYFWFPFFATMVAAFASLSFIACRTVSTWCKCFWVIVDRRFWCLSKFLELYCIDFWKKN